jgi:ATP-dependent Clp protease ATP-binding subunit ClpC
MFDNALDRFSNPLKGVLTRALVFASEKGSSLITPTHLLWALATQPQSLGHAILQRAHIALDQLTGSLPPSQKPLEKKETDTPHLSPDSRRILEKAILAANLHDHPYIGTEHLLFGFLQAQLPEVQTLLFQIARIERSAFEQTLTKTLKEAKLLTIDEQRAEPEKKHDPCEHCGELHEDEHETSALEYFGKELTKKEVAAKALPLVGRAQEIDRLATILARKTKHHPILLGDPGVGKTAIVEGLAQRVLSGKVPRSLKGLRIFSVDMGSLVAGAVYRGDFEARLLDIIDDLKSMKNAVIFIDEFHTVVGAGAGGSSLDAANILKPALARGEIRVIGATTREEYKKHIEPDGALARRFQRISVHEPDAKETLTILKGIAPSFAAHHQTSFAPGLLEEIVQLTERLMPTQRFPDKAIDVLDELGAKTAGRKATRDDLLRSIAEQTGAPLSSVQTSDRERLRKLEEALNAQVVGQEDTVKTVATTLVRAKLGLAPAERPLASFLFAGPSGVGKTALSKALARSMGVGKSPFLRLDMSEFSEAHSISRLIGSPAGYVGYKERAQLTDAVKELPSLVVVFDELEKAHRNVHHLLLQILEEGELRDASGTLVNFRNTVIVATTNAAKELFEKQRLGFTDKEHSQHALREQLEDRFSGELLNRFDALCLFKPLGSQEIQRIVRHELSLLKHRLKSQGIRLMVPADIASLVATHVERKKGGREVRHMLRKLIEEPLAEKIVRSPEKKRTFSVKKTSEGKLLLG